MSGVGVAGRSRADAIAKAAERGWRMGMGSRDNRHGWVVFFADERAADDEVHTRRRDAVDAIAFHGGWDGVTP